MNNNSYESKIFFNKASSEKLKWNPDSFGFSEFSEELIDEIEEFQKAHGLKVDGMVGPLTFKRMKLEEEELDSHIIVDGKEVYIDWPKVINLTEDGALVLPESNFNKRTSRRKTTMIVTHWDVCLSARECFKSLKRSGISTHFAIDNDGTIYQFVDTNDVAWHAGNKKVNSVSIGVDLSNAYYLKHQDKYEEPRPVLSNVKVHGKTLEPFLGFYDIQLEAYKVLIETLCNVYEIPLKTPDKDEEIPEVARGEFEGVVSHLHVTKNKIDCAGLDLRGILKEIEND